MILRCLKNGLNLQSKLNRNKVYLFTLPAQFDLQPQVSQTLGKDNNFPFNHGSPLYLCKLALLLLFEMSLPSPSHFYAYSTQTQPSDLAGVLYTFLSYYNLFLFYGSPHATCRILVPWPGIKPAPFTVKAVSVNHWTTREVPRHKF